MGVSRNTFASYLGDVKAPLNKLRQLGLTKRDPFKPHPEQRVARAYPDRTPAQHYSPNCVRWDVGVSFANKSIASQQLKRVNFSWWILKWKYQCIGTLFIQSLDKRSVH